MKVILSNAMKVIDKLNSATAARISMCEHSAEEERVEKYYKEIKLLLGTENQLITVIENAIDSDDASELLAALDAISDDDEIRDLLS